MNRRSKPIRKKFPRGFTIVEMLVILGIIAVLAAVLFPVMASGKAPAKDGGLPKMAQLANSMGMYEEDFSGTFVAIGAPAQDFAWSPAVNPNVDAAGNPWAGWGLKVAPYEPNYQALYNPPIAAQVSFSGECANSGPMPVTNEFAANWMLGSDGTYGDASNKADGYAWSPDGSRQFSLPAALASVNQPGSTIAFTPSNAAAPINQRTGCLIATIQASDFSNAIKPYSFTGDGANIGFVDGHASHVNDSRLTAAYQGTSGPWRVYHLETKQIWMEPTMPTSTLGYTNVDASGNSLGNF